MERIIERTDDGSATLFVPELNEHYHSTKGARTESQHIFIDRLELYPLDWQTVEQLGYISSDEQLTIHRKQTTTDEQFTPNEEKQQSAIKLFKQLHTSPWEKDVQLTPHFTLRKIETDVNKWRVENGELRVNNSNDSVVDSQLSTLNSPFNLVYFDAFAPEKQPEMWSQELFNRLYVLLDRDGILTTYCAKGVVRRMLQTAGFTVERLPGPPGGKREILRARKQE